MKKAAQWTIVTLIWVFALGCACIGLFLLVFGSMLGPRGDIDFGGFKEAKKQARVSVGTCRGSAVITPATVFN